MRLPRDLSGADLARLLRKFDYVVTRQSGSHMRLTTTKDGEHHIIIPNHDALRIGTLSGILADVAAHIGCTREELMQDLFGG